MVKLEEIIDADKERSANHPYSNSSAASSSASLSSVASSAVSDAVDDIEKESLLDRFAALVDIIPPSTRFRITNGIKKSANLLMGGGRFAGNAVWIVTTSALLVALPLALVLEDEAKIVQQEREIMAQQQGQQVRLSFGLGRLLSVGVEFRRHPYLPEHLRVTFY